MRMNKGPLQYFIIYPCFITLGSLSARFPCLTLRTVFSTIWLNVSLPQSRWSLSLLHTVKNHKLCCLYVINPCLLWYGQGFCTILPVKEITLGDIMNTWLPLNSKPRALGQNESEYSSLPVNNLSKQSIYAALDAVWNHYVPLQEVHKEAGQQFEQSVSIRK